jgi:hypothetical protein
MSVHKDSLKGSELTEVKTLHLSSRKRQEAKDDATRQCKNSWGQHALRKADIMIPYGSYSQIMLIHKRNVEETMQRRRQERELQKQHKILQLSRHVFGRRLMIFKIMR